MLKLLIHMGDDMDDKSTPQAPAKLPYSKPKFFDFGTLHDITMSVGNTGQPDGASGMNHKTRP